MLGIDSNFMKNTHIVSGIRYGKLYCGGFGVTSGRVLKGVTNLKYVEKCDLENFRFSDMTHFLLLFDLNGSTQVMYVRSTDDFFNDTVARNIINSMIASTPGLAVYYINGTHFKDMHKSISDYASLIQCIPSLIKTAGDSYRIGCLIYETADLNKAVKTATFKPSAISTRFDDATEGNVNGYNIVSVNGIENTRFLISEADSSYNGSISAIEKWQPILNCFSTGKDETIYNSEYLYEKFDSLIIKDGYIMVPDNDEESYASALEKLSSYNK